MQKETKKIHIQTLLARNATKDANALLKKYNVKPARSYDDLEVKLAELYDKVPDINKFEKEMAEIHPHKDWILKKFLPAEKEATKEVSIKEEKAIPIVVEEPKAPTSDEKLESFKEELKQVFREELANNQPKSNFNADGGCINECTCKKCRDSYSNIEGNDTPKQANKTEGILPYVGMIAVFGMVGLVLVVTLKSVK